ncbi:hypothetical protein Ppb6_01906 [Photorhabdus australis subsp. thailandensis]|uniref:Uncharacterized protein n=1 Tax=Photorhabdus australis subsp. thailandensis TaxID=2805096 RepID=A0A1C0U4K0_9GAMM|nr:hypothetical protein [Photorhabdus australis]OCQ52847.1 hypothetical protein Ppb6_01906 [Photorhabdus australis subsp. thailandensis]
MAILPTSFSQFRGIRAISSPESPSRATEHKLNDKGKIRRVRDIKSAERLAKKRPKLFRIRSVQSTRRNQRDFARRVNGDLLRAISDWHGYVDQLPEPEELDDATLFVVQSAYHSRYLYPKDVYEKLSVYLEKLEMNTDDLLEVDAELIQNLLARDNVISDLMTLLNLCRCYEKHKVRLKQRGVNE